jgi:DEAD/DEAH box helicase domain-containing protein
VVRRVSGYKKIRYYTHENIGYGPVTLPDQELHTTAVWWQLPQPVLEAAFASRQHALDGFLGAAYALHLVASVSVMAEARDLQKAVGSGDGAWFAAHDGRGRGQLRGGDGLPMDPAATDQFLPTVYLYDAYPGGIGLSEPLHQRRDDLVGKARALLAGCDCRGGCPACVGPVLAADESSVSPPKALADQVLALLAERA